MSRRIEDVKEIRTIHGSGYDSSEEEINKLLKGGKWILLAAGATSMNDGETWTSYWFVAGRVG